MPNTNAKTDNQREIIAGRNAVMEAIRAGRPIDRILVARGSTGSIAKIYAMAKQANILLREEPEEALNKLCSSRHQGVIALAEAYRYSTVEEILARAQSRGEDPFLILCDGIEDPHNLGAILRTAECAGAHGVIIGKRRSASLTEVVSRASAGAVEHILCARVTNLARTMEELKKAGLWIAACDMEGDRYDSRDLTGPLALVLGSEGEGLRRLVKEKCDFTVSIPLCGRVSSLNVSNAAAVLMYEVRRQRDGK